MIPKISVLVPVYNVELYIKKCAESLFKNTIASTCEFIFTNDCSTDSSLQVLEKTITAFPNLKNNIKVFNHDKNYGLGKTRNTSFDNASGEYIICVDSDDWVEPNYLESLYNKAKENAADIVGCNCYFEFEKTNITKSVIYELKESGKECLIDLYQDKIGGYLWIKLIKRTFLTKNNIQWANDVSMWEDVLIDTKMFTNNPKVSYVQKNLYHYLIRNGSYLHTMYTTKKADDIFKAITYINEYLETNHISYAINIFQERAYIIKYSILSQGNRSAQKKYIALYPELNKYMTKKNTKPFYRFIISISNRSTKLAYSLLFLFNCIKILIGKISKNEYFDK